MDFIFYEIKDAIIQRNTVPYAPYIMLLIKHALGEYDLTDDCVDHQVKKMYVKKKKTPALSLLIQVPTWLMQGRVLLLVNRGLLLLPCPEK
jgi:hypothetical protein